MDEGVELRCFGTRWENGKFSDLTYWKKQRSKLEWLRKTFVSRNREQKSNTVKQAQEECQTQQNTNSRSCINVNSSPARPIFCPIPQSSKPMPRPADQGFDTPQQPMIPRPNLFQTPNTGNQSAQGTPTTPNATPNKENTTCFNCGQKGHYANRCPSR
jgi:hypothetical protein